MTVFFLVIGLEVKRELTIGRLRDPGRATLPILAALAGAAVPALVFLALNPSGPAARGWAIPIATNPAFAVGVLAPLGSRVSAGAKAFLFALAVVDDIAAVTVIAIALHLTPGFGVAGRGRRRGPSRGAAAAGPGSCPWPARGCWGCLGSGCGGRPDGRGCMPPSPEWRFGSPSRPARSGAAPGWSCWRAGCIWCRPILCAAVRPGQCRRGLDAAGLSAAWGSRVA